MTIPSNPQNDFSPFLPSTFNMPDDDERVTEFIGKTFSDFSDVVNDKIIGMFVQDAENFNGHKYFYDTTSKLRNGFRFLLRVTSYPNTSTLTLSIPIIVNSQFVVSQVWGSASKPCSAVGAGDGDYFSFYSQGNTKISFTMSDLSVVITTTSDMTAYNGFIIVDYIKDG